MTILASLRDGVSRLVLETAGGWQMLARTGRLMCGIGDYDAYVMHQRAAHPGAAVLDYASFVRQRQDVRYGRNGVRCC
jgi:uncharacterized short protein YbdD (DUF466 family)